MVPGINHLSFESDCQQFVVGPLRPIGLLVELDHGESTTFMYFTLLWAAKTGVFDLGGSSTIAHLTGEQLRRYRFPKPPLPEQTAIAEFLDRETAKIDGLMGEQRRLIELLKEKRQAVISHAVTRGLNPNAPLKPSGLEWLGDVPAHWMVASVRRVVQRIEQGWSPECFGRPADGNEWGVVKSGCVNRGTFVEQENKALSETIEPVPEYEIRSGDVLMSRASGSPELVGSTAYITAVRPKLMLSDKIFRIHPEPIIDRRFFCGRLQFTHDARTDCARDQRGGRAREQPPAIGDEVFHRCCASARRASRSRSLSDSRNHQTRHPHRRGPTCHRSVARTPFRLDLCHRHGQDRCSLHRRIRTRQTVGLPLTMSYRDPLPEGCPPDAAEEITALRVVFRLVRTNPPTEADFLSQRQEKPDRAFPGVTECQACGLSVFADQRDVETRARKLPHLRNRRICRVTLPAGAGRIQQTFQPSHHTWWPFAALDILAHCEVGNPMKAIRHTTTLFYYDGPQVFEARDAIGGALRGCHGRAGR